jgi:hypothetical protein
MEYILRNSPAGLSNRNFHINEFFVDNFSDCDSASDFVRNDTKLSGLQVLQPAIYSAQIVAATAATTCFQYYVWSRILVISPLGTRYKLRPQFIVNPNPALPV